MKKMMTKMFSAVCASALLAGSAAMLPASAEEIQSAPHIMGDLNRDCRVTMADAKLALDVAVMSSIGLMDKETTEETNPADINMNGTVEIADAIAIMRYYCRTMINDQPLWAEIRKLSYTDGTEYDPFYMDREEGEESSANLPFEKRGLYVEIGCAEGKPGEKVTVPVYIAGANKMTAFEYVGLYPEKLELTRIQSEFGVDYAKEYDEEAGGFRWFKNTVPALGDGFTSAAVNEELRIGVLAWMSLNGVELDVQEGKIIANYTYQIPEDAKAGDTFILTSDTKKNRFNAAFDLVGEGDDEKAVIENYQYTLLDGVIAVK